MKFADREDRRLASKFPSGARLRALRESRAVSVEEVAVHVGKSAYTIQGYELCRIEPPVHVLQSIAGMLDTTVGEILGERVGDGVTVWVADLPR